MDDRFVRSAMITSEIYDSHFVRMHGPFVDQANALLQDQAPPVIPSLSSDELAEGLVLIINLLRGTDDLQRNGFACDAVDIARSLLSKLGGSGG